MTFQNSRPGLETKGYSQSWATQKSKRGGERTGGRGNSPPPGKNEKKPWKRKTKWIPYGLGPIKKKGAFTKIKQTEGKRRAMGSPELGEKRTCVLRGERKNHVGDVVPLTKTGSGPASLNKKGNTGWTDQKRKSSCLGRESNENEK